MNHLTPCPGCQRHVRVRETFCPFCNGALDLSAIPPPMLPATRLGRAAIFAFGATMAAGISSVSCGSDGSGGSGGGGGTGAIAPPYGHPDGGESGDAGSDATAGNGGLAGSAALYGISGDY